MPDQNLGRAVLELTTDPKVFIKGLNRAFKDAKKFSNKLAGVQQSAQRMGRSMTRSLTLPLVALAAASTKMAADYEESMSKIVGLVGVARDQVDGWSEDILEIASSFGKAPKEMADAMFFITSAGLRSAEAFDALTMAAKASVGGLGDMTSIADALTSAMNAYGSETLDAAKATDVLVATVREGKLEAADLASSIGAVIPLAAEMGVTFNEVGAAIASLTRIGFSVDQAGTSLQAIMSGLLKPTEQAEEALERFGTTAAELRQRVRDDGLLVTLSDLKDVIGDNDTAIAEIFPNVRALRGVLGLMGENAENTMQILDNMADVTGATDKAFEEASKTLKFKFNVAMSDLKTALTFIGLEIGPIIIPVLQEITGWIKELAQKFKDMGPEAKQFMLKLALMAALVGPVALAFAGLIAVFRAVSIAIRLMANPYILLGVAIVGVTILIVKNWEKLQIATAELGESLREIWDGIAEVITGKNKWMADNMVTTFEFLNDGITNQVKHIAGNILFWLVTKMEVLVLRLGIVWLQIQNTYVKGMNFIRWLVGGRQEPLFDAQIVMAKAKADALSKLWSDTLAAGDQAHAINAKARQEDYAREIQEINNLYAEGDAAGRAKITEGKNALADQFADIGEGIMAKAKGLVDGVVGAFKKGKEVWKFLGVGDLISGIEDAFASIGKTMDKAGENVKDKLKDGAKAIEEAAKELGKAIPAGPRPAFDRYGEPLNAFGSPLVPFVPSEQPEAEGGGIDPIKMILSALKDAAMGIENFAKIMDPLATIFGAMFKVLEPAINGVLIPVVGALEAIGAALGETLMPVILALAPVFDLIVQMVMSSLMPILDAFGASMSLVAAILTALEPVFKAFNVAMEVLSSPLKWLGDVLEWVGSKFQAFGHWLKHVFAFEFGQAAKVSFGGKFKSDAFTGLEARIAAIWNRDFSPETILAEGATVAGAGATFEQQRPIFVDIDVHDNEYYGDGTWRDFALALRDEFEQIGVLGL